MASPGYAVAANVDLFLKVDGIEGESPDDKHKNEIQLLSYNFGATQPGSAGLGGGVGIGKVQLHDFNFTKHTDKSSPKLFAACASGKHLPSVILTCRKAGGTQQEYMKVTLSEVIISSVSTSHETGSTLPIENYAMNFTKIEYEYKPQDEKGNLGGVIKASHDAAKNVTQ
jgi:type VI secretion system secreted protein Hcp